MNVRLAALLFVVLLGVGGCSGSVSSTKSSSPAELIADLPNLANINIATCTFSSDRETHRSVVPIPSTSQSELIAAAVLADETAIAAMDWRVVPLADVPAPLRGLVGTGVTDVLVSAALNKSFETNPHYQHGYVIRSPNELLRIWILARDGEHPIK